MYLAALKGLSKNPACERTASLLRLVSLEKESNERSNTLRRNETAFGDRAGIVK